MYYLKEYWLWEEESAVYIRDACFLSRREKKWKINLCTIYILFIFQLFSFCQL